MKKHKILNLIVIAILVSMLFIPSIYTEKKVHYDESCDEYGWFTHYTRIEYYNWGRLCGVSERGDIYLLFVKHSEKYEKVIESPSPIGFAREVYISDSVVYVGTWNGKMYYADPMNGKIIWTIELKRLHTYFNATNNTDIFNGYDILWGNRSGYFYLLFNHTIYHLYRDVKILDKYSYNFTGYFISSYYWNGGLILKFGEYLWEKGKRYLYHIYYVKDGKIMWNLTLPASIDLDLRYYERDIYIYEDYVYYYRDSLITVYKDGRRIKELYTEGDVAGLKRFGDKLYVYTYLGMQNLLFLYNKDYKLLKRVELFDMKSMGIRNYDVRNQRVSMYENNSGYTVFLYTTPWDWDSTPYIPLRMIYLDKNLNVTWSNWAKVKWAFDVYPTFNKNEFILLSEDADLYLVNVKERVIVDPYGWMDIKLPVFGLSLFMLWILYVLWYIVNTKKLKPPEIW